MILFTLMLALSTPLLAEEKVPNPPKEPISTETSSEKDKKEEKIEKNVEAEQKIENEEPPKKKKATITSFKKYEIAFYPFGSSFSVRSENEASASGTTLQSDTSGSPSGSSSLGLNYRFTHLHAINFTLQSMKHKYNNGETEDDNQLIVFSQYRAYCCKNQSRAQVWGGVGLGAAFIDFGTTSASSGNIIAELEYLELTALLINARMGVDLYFLDNMAITMGIGYNKIKYDNTLEVRNISSNTEVDIEIEVKRNWWDYFLGLKYLF